MTNPDLKPEAKQNKIHLRYTLLLSTPEGQVSHYLLRNPLWGESKGRTLFMEGAMLLWLPRARKTVDPQGAREAALHSVKAMLTHIRDLVGEFNLTEIEGVQISPQLTIPLSAIGNAPASSSDPAPIAAAPISPTTVTPIPTSTLPGAASPNQTDLSQPSEFILPSECKEVAGFFDGIDIMLN